MLNTMVLQAEQISQAASTIMSAGVIGACLVSLAIWHVLLSRKYDKRVDSMLAREREFQEIQSAALEKYRTAMESVAKTLDLVVTLIRDR
jgi:hypothetical protein